MGRRVGSGVDRFSISVGTGVDTVGDGVGFLVGLVVVGTGVGDSVRVTSGHGGHTDGAGEGGGVVMPGTSGQSG